MTSESQPELKKISNDYRWSLRILVLGMCGICLLTLYPFHINPHAHRNIPNPLRLAGWAKTSSTFDMFLNVLLFVPFGFGLAGLLRKQGLSRTKTALLVLIAGAVVSYGVELTQFFIPDRDSGWEDVFTNSSGALAGGIFFLGLGLALLRLLQRCEKVIEEFLTVKNAAILLACYFAVWCALSARLQRLAGLQDWHTNSLLTVGGLAHTWSASAWKGKISAVEFWDRALPGDVASRITSSPWETKVSGWEPFSSYRSSGAAPFTDTQGRLPALGFRLMRIGSAMPVTGTWDGNFWLATATPVSDFVSEIRRTGQFSIHIEFTPAEGGDMNASLVRIGTAESVPDLEIGQASEALAFWFHNSLTAIPYQLEWSISHECEPNQPRSVIFSYDGSNLWAYINGRFVYAGYRLGPATAVARLVRHLKSMELQGYRYTFYGIVFFPAGCLLGLVWRKLRGSVNLLALIALGTIAPCVLLEGAITLSGKQPMSAGDVYLAAFMSAAGLIWINLEGWPAKTPAEAKL